MKRTRNWVGAAVLGLIVVGPARADLIGLVPLLPDVKADFITVKYDSSSNLFTAIGNAATIEEDGAPPEEYTFNAGLFDLTVTVDESGIVSGGSLLITDTLAGPTITTFLTASPVTAFGFVDPPPGGGQLFEFVFDVTGGTLAAAMGPQVSVILHASTWATPFDGTWDTSFENLGGGTADITPVPAPSSAFLALFGLVVGAKSFRRLRPTA